MLTFLSSWAKSLGVTIVLVSILEMLLPNNKTKKYIRMVLGVFVIFNIISPFIQNKEILNLNSIDLENMTSIETSTLDQSSMDQRIEDLYEDELEKDMINKLEEQGYEVTKCKVTATLSQQGEEESQIERIELKVEKKEEEKQEQEESAENKIVTEIQKIKKIDTKITDETENRSQMEENNQQTKVTKAEIQNIKKFLIEEYGVKEKCLAIN